MTDMVEKRKAVHRATADKIAYFDKSVEELKEKAWELDTSTQDMLMFHGVKDDTKHNNLDAAVKEVWKEMTEEDYINNDGTGDEVKAEDITGLAFSKGGARGGRTYHCAV